LLVQGQTDDALAEYATALALADTVNLNEIETDLRDAIAKHPGIPEAEQTLTRIDERRRVLESRDTQVPE
jgi:DNA-binding Lrp family transcriptional regulator